MITRCADELNKFLLWDDKTDTYIDFKSPHYRNVTNSKARLYNISTVAIIASLALGILGHFFTVAVIGFLSGLFAHLIIKKSFVLQTPKSNSQNPIIKFADYCAGTMGPRPDWSFFGIVIFYRED
jgi:hypothetical protein